VCTTNSDEVDNCAACAPDIFPNPTQNEVTIRFNNSENEEHHFRLFSIEGLLIKSFSTKQQEYRLALPEEKGIYILESLSGTDVSYSRILKI